MVDASKRSSDDVDDVAVCVDDGVKIEDALRDERLLDAYRTFSSSASTCDDRWGLAETGSAAERWMCALKENPTGWTRQKSIVQTLSASSLSSLTSSVFSTVRADSTGSDASSTAGKSGERTRIYYRCDSKRTLSVRVETVIARDMLVPLLSVLNESELYSSWLPKWTSPTRLGVRESVKVAQVGRCSQLVIITCDAPWPLETRQVVLDAVAFDDMDANGDIGVLLRTRDCDTDTRVPPKPSDEEITRIEVDGAFLFRRVPSEWAKDVGGEVTSVAQDDILVSFGFTVDPKLDYIPTWLLNFIVRTVIGTLWGAFIRVAEEVRDGLRPAHAEVITKKREHLYEWVEQRASCMFAI